MEKFKTRKLGEICAEGNGAIKTGPFGTQLHKSDYEDEGIPVVMPKDFANGSIDTTTIARVNSKLVERLSQHKLKEGDIIYARRGDIGRRAYITKREKNWLCGTGCLKLNPGDGELDSKYLFYYLGDKSVTEMIYNQAIGATMANLNTQILSDVDISYPSLGTQQKIASILSAFDDLIENNSRRIALLEETARLIYREWFIHYRYPGHEHDNMVDTGTEFGKVPEGWEVRKLKEFGKIETGKTPPKNNPNNYGNFLPFIKTPDMHDQLFIINTVDNLSEIGAKTQKKKTIPPNSICVSCIGTAGIVALTSVPSQTNQQINSIILNKDSTREYLYYAIKDLKPLMESIGSTGATMTNVSKGRFQALEIVWPGKAIVEKYHMKVDQIFDQIKVLQKQNLKLKTIRDLLLPKLISGEV